MASKILCVVALLAACLIQGHGANPLFSEINDFVKSTSGAVASSVGDIVNQITDPEAPARSQVNNDQTLQTALGKAVKQNLDEILGKVKDAIEQGKTVREDTLQRLKDIRSQLNSLRVDIDEKGRELVSTISTSIKNAIDKLVQDTANFATNVVNNVNEQVDNVAANAVNNVNEQVNELTDDASNVVSGASVSLNL